MAHRQRLSEKAIAEDAEALVRDSGSYFSERTARVAAELGAERPSMRARLVGKLRRALRRRR